MSDTITFNTHDHSLSTRQSNFKCSGYGLGVMVSQMSNPKVLEIGCDIGDTTQFLLDSNPTLELVGVDPYENYIDWNGNNLNEREVVYQQFKTRVSGYNNRFILHRDFSDNVHQQFDDEKFDVIFIDGLHTYEQLTKDCANYYSKLKPGGIFAGHDYTAITGVKRAADEFASQVNKQILKTECDVWYWLK